MSRLVRFYIRHVLIGFAVAAGFVALLLWMNVGNLWHLVSTSDVGVLAVFLLFMFNGIVFSGVQFGIAVMALGRDDGAGRGRGKRPAQGTVPHPGRDALPIPVDGDRPRDRRDPMIAGPHG